MTTSFPILEIFFIFFLCAAVVHSQHEYCLEGVQRDMTDKRCVIQTKTNFTAWLTYLKPKSHNQMKWITTWVNLLDATKQHQKRHKDRKRTEKKKKRNKWNEIYDDFESVFFFSFYYINQIWRSRKSDSCFSRFSDLMMRKQKMKNIFFLNVIRLILTLNGKNLNYKRVFMWFHIFHFIFFVFFFFFLNV